VGDWDIVTLSSRVSSSRVSKKFHRKCKHPLNPTKLYISGWVVSSLSVLFASHNMIGWHIFIGRWNNMYLYDKLFYTLAYPFACLVALYVVLLILRWSSIYWCEQMRETLVVNREVMVLLRSPPGLDSTVLDFVIGPWPMYWLILLNLNWFTVEPCILFCFDIVVCLKYYKKYAPRPRYYVILYDVSFD